MVLKRFESELPGSEKANIKLLGEQLYFKTAKRTVPNRFFKAGLSECMASYTPEDPQNTGIPNKKVINLYSKWGHGGFGMISTGNIIVQHEHLEGAGNGVVSKENESKERNEILKDLAKVMKADGAVAIAQLSHAGRQTPVFVNPTPFSPSSVQLEHSVRGSPHGVPVELTLEQVQTEVIDRFIYAAKEAHNAGFDGIEIHAAHGFLIANFLSPNTNKRTDKYGGDAKKRVQVLVDIYNGIRKEIPASTGFIIGIKLNSVEFQRGGMGLEDAILTAKTVDELGFDFIEFTGGDYEAFKMVHIKDSTIKREAFFVEFVDAIRPHLKNVVIYITGGFRTAPAMVKAVEDKTTDGVGLGRPSTAEPDLPKKILDGRARGAAFNKVEGNFVHCSFISAAQMVQASQYSWEECNNDACYGIMDLTHDDEFTEFFVVFEKYFSNFERLLVEEKKVLFGGCPYVPKYTGKAK